MSKRDFTYLAKQLMFELSEEELHIVERDFIILDKQFKLLDKIDVEGIEPMIYADQQETNFLREDVIGESLTVEEVLKNAKKTKDNMIVVAKVVNR